jgi:photosystem II stability/assembly factor-like uncharacterized protein
MADELLRRNLGEAFDPGVGFPHPLLLSRTMAAIAAEAPAAQGARARRRLSGHGDPPGDGLRAMGLVAALLAVAIVAALLLGAHVLRPKTTTPVAPPTVPPTSQVRGNAPCPGYGQVDVNQYSVIPKLMVSPTTGWAQGALRTTDGGAHWHGTLPASFFSGAPKGTVIAPGTGVYPPAYADFFLDNARGWAARAWGSPTSCVDHLSAYVTSDGGRTWQQSAPIALTFKTGVGLGVKLDFVDPQDGWMLVGASSAGDFWPDPVYLTESFLLATTDGGATWGQVTRWSSPGASAPSQGSCKPGPAVDVMFASTSTGYASVWCNAVGSLLVTRDGGATWMAQRFPAGSGTTCPCQPSLPHFFDAHNGVIQIGSTMMSTSDGGQTWQALPALPGRGFQFALSYVDATDWWDLPTAPGWEKGVPGTPTNFELYHTTDGGHSWTPVNLDVPGGWLFLFMQFVDADHGMLAEAPFLALQGSGGLTPTGPWSLVVTSDGGLTWKAFVPVVT